MVQTVDVMTHARETNAADATASLDVPLREERPDAVRGYLDADEARR